MAIYSDKLPGWFSREPGARNEPATTGATSTTGGDLDQEPVVVWQAANGMEAQVVKGRLESEGIPAIVRGEVLSAIYGLTTGSLAATDVLVPAVLAEKAIALLHEEVEWEDSEMAEDYMDQDAAHQGSTSDQTND